MPNERVTVTLPPDVIRDIDKQERNRSRFILQAVRRELDHRRRQALHRSLKSPHPESGEIADAGLAEWLRDPPEEDRELVDPKAGTEVRWTPGEGWTQVEE